MFKTEGHWDSSSKISDIRGGNQCVGVSWLTMCATMSRLYICPPCSMYMFVFTCYVCF